MRLLFPLDGSEPTYRALEKGLQLIANDPKSTATLLVVMSRAFRDMPKEAREHLEFDDEDELFIRDDEANAVIQKGQEIAKKLKIQDCKGMILIGKPKETILSESKKHDVLVMHGLAKDEKAEKSRGSALEEIARNAPCSVLLVRV